MPYLNNAGSPSASLNMSARSRKGQELHTKRAFAQQEYVHVGLVALDALQSPAEWMKCSSKLCQILAEVEKLNNAQYNWVVAFQALDAAKQWKGSLRRSTFCASWNSLCLMVLRKPAFCGDRFLFQWRPEPRNNGENAEDSLYSFKFKLIKQQLCIKVSGVLSLTMKFRITCIRCSICLLYHSSVPSMA